MFLDTQFTVVVNKEMDNGNKTTYAFFKYIAMDWSVRFSKSDQRFSRFVAHTNPAFVKT